ncbi:hypothetical protein LCGC14_0718900 [marine sediment metagenome]|uniref:Uncharacterized protein n=1 Tax=marine sediment metagenome TaxID=412755 RepID=A0A0F9QY29_9ZZZZ
MYIEYNAVVKEACEVYRKGLISLAEAATLAEVSLYVMMDFVEREKILPKVLTDEEMEEELRNTKELFKNMKK